MKGMILLASMLWIWSATAFAVGIQYNLRVDGLSCPFCAYGIEKKLTRSEGVESVIIDLEKGLVIVKVKEGITFTEAHFKKLVDDAGFTLKSVTEASQ